jgi:anti-sigma factor RsiW
MTNSDTELEAYLDEALPAEAMTRIESEARRSPELARRLAAINARRDAGAHSLGEIWRRHRLTCPSRAELGSYLLGVLPEEHARYVAFHLDDIGCRVCTANHADLERQQAETADAASHRRRKYFESSAGYLRRK